MKIKFSISLIYFALICLVVGCGDKSQSHKQRFVDGINEQRVEFLLENRKYYSDYRAILDSETGEIIIEFSYAVGLELGDPKLMLARRSTLVKQYSNDPELRDFLLSGNILRVRYLTSDGILFFELSISKEDL